MHHFTFIKIIHLNITQFLVLHLFQHLGLSRSSPCGGNSPTSLRVVPLLCTALPGFDIIYLLTHPLVSQSELLCQLLIVQTTHHTTIAAAYRLLSLPPRLVRRFRIARRCLSLYPFDHICICSPSRVPQARGVHVGRLNRWPQPQVAHPSACAVPVARLRCLLLWRVKHARGERVLVCDSGAH